MKYLSFCVILLAALSYSPVESMDLDSTNWDSSTGGKAVFVKFMAPWCGHCKALKPAWDTLVDKFKDNEDRLVGTVDCTADSNKEFCQKMEVKGFPTLKYGDPSNLKDYSGSRDLDALEAFAKTIPSVCDVTKIEACSQETQAAFAEITKLPVEEVKGEMKEADDKILKLEGELKAKTMELQGEVDKIRSQFMKFKADIDGQVAELKLSSNYDLKQKYLTSLEKKEEAPSSEEAPKEE